MRIGWLGRYQVSQRFQSVIPETRLRTEEWSFLMDGRMQLLLKRRCQVSANNDAASEDIARAILRVDYQRNGKPVRHTGLQRDIVLRQIELMKAGGRLIDTNTQQGFP